MAMTALVTGGGGFLGGAIVRRLLERGDRVRSLSRGFYPTLHKLDVRQFQGDVYYPETVLRATEGCDIVFHVAAKAGVGGPYQHYYTVNVVGTRNVLAACRANGISRLVYTSSPSVVFDGRDMEGVNESTPYPKQFEASYPKTKAIAERAILEANSPTLATVALRPHLIWGPGDNQLVPRILARGRAGKLRRIGKQNKLIDTIYVDNAADAHLLAADRLAPGSAIAGKAYFLSQGEPIPLWDMVNRILAAGGVAPVTRSVPVSVAYLAGWCCEMLYDVMRWHDEPPLTRFVARELSTAHWFDITAARRDLGYEPRVSLDEGLRRLEAWLRSPVASQG